MLPTTNPSLFCRMHENSTAQAAWHDFYDAYRDTMYTWSIREGIPPDQAEDLVQEVFAKLITALATFDQTKGRFRSWLKTIVKNAIYDRFRAEGELRGVGGSAHQAALNNRAKMGDIATSGFVHRASLATELFARVRARVEPNTWDAFVRRAYLDEPVGEVAEAIGVKKASIYKYVTRVKRLVNEEFERSFR